MVRRGGWTVVGRGDGCGRVEEERRLAGGCSGAKGGAGRRAGGRVIVAGGAGLGNGGGGGESYLVAHRVSWVALWGGVRGVGWRRCDGTGLIATAAAAAAAAVWRAVGGGGRVAAGRRAAVATSAAAIATTAVTVAAAVVAAAAAAAATVATRRLVVAWTAGRRRHRAVAWALRLVTRLRHRLVARPLATAAAGRGRRWLTVGEVNVPIDAESDAPCIESRQRTASSICSNSTKPTSFPLRSWRVRAEV